MGEVRIGVIGRGFGLRVVAPVFEQTQGCKVVDVVSPRDEPAVAALCARNDVDLISVHSPPFMHSQHVRWAIDGGHDVLCDKPFGRNASEAGFMHQLARDAGVVNLVNFEMRFDPVRRRLRQLIMDGCVGRPQHLLLMSWLSITRVPLRPHSWLFDAGRGGGWTGAWGSHIIDFIRWTLGDVADASGRISTAIAERPDSEGRLRRCTADDTFTAMLTTVTGSTATIDGTSAAPVSLPSHTLVIGSEGLLRVTGDRSITRYGTGGSSAEIEVDEGGGDLSFAMRRWSEVVRDSVQRGSADTAAPTFADGLACRRVLDRILDGQGP
jgi:predicted dehydrogenase